MPLRGAPDADLCVTNAIFATMLFPDFICFLLGSIFDGIQVFSGAVVCGIFYLVLNGLNIRQFWQNRDYRKSDKFLFFCLIAVLSIIVTMALKSYNSIANMTLLFLVFCLCHYVTAQFHRSAMIVQKRKPKP